MFHSVQDPRPSKPDLEKHSDGAFSEEPETPSSAGQRLGPSEQIETLPSDRLHRARDAYRRYYRRLRLSRLALGAFVLMALVFILWMVPWLPSGLNTDDYTPELAFTVYLLGGAAIAGIAALGLRELAHRDREMLLLWATVYDEATGLHNRTYLYDRLSLECDRAERGSAAFTVVVLQMRVTGEASGTALILSKGVVQDVAERLRGILRPADLVAHLSDGEIAILATGTNHGSRQALAERLRNVVAERLPELLDKPAAVAVKAGAATYGVDGCDPDALVHCARTAAMLAVPDRGQAA